MSTVEYAKTRPLVSIIVLSYNQGLFLSQTLDSILQQDYRPLEVVVVDGASTDNSVEILKDYSSHYSEIVWCSEPDEGVADAVNKGLTVAHGVYAGIQSSDDLYLPGAISQAVALLDQDAKLDLVCGNIDTINGKGEVVSRWRNQLPLTINSFLCRATIIHQSSTFFRLAAARTVGGWNRDFFCADAEMWLRMLFQPNRKVLGAANVWSHWRKHPGQRNEQRREMWDGWGLMIANSAEVRRASIFTKLAARSGRYMVAMSYNPTTSRMYQLLQMWKAILIYPPSIFGVHSKSSLVPGLTRGLNLIRRNLATKNLGLRG